MALFKCPSIYELEGNILESIILFHVSIIANIFGTTAFRLFLPSVTLSSQIFAAYHLVNKNGSKIKKNISAWTE